MINGREDVLERLGGLAIHDLPAARAERIAGDCRRRLARRRPVARRSVPRRLVPAAVVLLAVLYLSWAVERALVLLGVVGGI